MPPKKDQASGKSGKKAKAREGLDAGQLAKMLGLLKYQAQHGKVQVKKRKLPSFIYILLLCTIYQLPTTTIELLSAFCSLPCLPTLNYYLLCTTIVHILCCSHLDLCCAR